MATDEGSTQPNGLRPPQISHAEMLSFQQSHFSPHAVINFGQGFTDLNVNHQGSEEQHYDDYWEEEDDLGYYEDGVKRTLTDEQIEIFRHSELRDLRRQEEKPSKLKSEPLSDASMTEAQEPLAVATRSDVSSNQTSKRKKKKKPAKGQNREPKPDLRKRTWDVVEAGLDSLDYD